MDIELSITPAAAHRTSDEVIFADTVFGFWEEFQDSSENSSNSSNDEEIDDDDDEEEDDSICPIEKNKTFWEEQDQLLKVHINLIQVQLINTIPRTLNTTIKNSSV